MPRNRTIRTSNHHQRPTTTNNSTALMAITKALRSETDYRSALKKINANAMILAESLSRSGPIEQSLLDATSSPTMENERQLNTEFLDDQRTRLKSLVGRNIRSERTVSAFVESVTELKHEVQERERNRKRRWTDDELNDDDDQPSNPPEEEPPPDYETVLRTKMDTVKKAQDENSVAIEDEVWMRRCREKLGEKLNGSSGRGRNNDDDELEVVVNHPSQRRMGSAREGVPGTNAHDAALRCKMTLQRFVRPYRNKICNHVFEYDAIMTYLRTKKACPMPGCTNQSMTEGQFEEDEEIMIKVRSLKRKEEEEEVERARVKEQSFEDDDEDERGTMGDVGVTMID